MGTKMRILLLSAYDTDSHRSWCKGLMAHLPEIDWTYLTLPGRYFSWRIRGNAMSWATGPERELLQQNYDKVLATSMVDLCSVRGLFPNLANTPCYMYFHENQLAYPKSQGQHTSIEPQMVNLYGALAADKVLFNSQYNRASFLQEGRKLIKQLPDHNHVSMFDDIEKKSQVLPVPIAPSEELIDPPAFRPGEPLRVIWNHRWEYDKGPDTLLHLANIIEQKSLNIELTIAGLSFRQQPKALQTLMENKRDKAHLKHVGTFEARSDYLNALINNHVVLSTAIHEFQGLAMLEGAAYGCTPLAPNRLAYPEWVDTACLYSDNPDSPLQEAESIAKQLQNWQQNGLPKAMDVSGYYWVNMAQNYRDFLL